MRRLDASALKRQVPLPTTILANFRIVFLVSKLSVFNEEDRCEVDFYDHTAFCSQVAASHGAGFARGPLEAGYLRSVRRDHSSRRFVGSLHRYRLLPAKFRIRRICRIPLSRCSVPCAMRLCLVVVWWQMADTERAFCVAGLNPTPEEMAVEAQRKTAVTFIIQRIQVRNESLMKHVVRLMLLRHLVSAVHSSSL